MRADETEPRPPRDAAVRGDSLSTRSLIREMREALARYAVSKEWTNSGSGKAVHVGFSCCICNGYWDIAQAPRHEASCLIERARKK